jgi:hypothetical protein
VEKKVTNRLIFILFVISLVRKYMTNVSIGDSIIGMLSIASTVLNGRIFEKTNMINNDSGLSP